METAERKRLTTRTIVLTGLLASLTIVLATTPIGLIPIPNASGAMTTVHLPVIVGGIALGPIAGSLLGLILGLFTLRFAPWFVVIPARLLIGPVAYLVYRSIPNRTAGAALAAVAGTLANTIGVLGAAVVAKLMPLSAALGVAALNGTLEVILAVVVVTPVIRALIGAKLI